MGTITNINLNRATEVEIGDKKIKLDFSDKRLLNKILKLMKKYQNIESEINTRVEEIEKNEGMSDLDKIIAYSDVEIDVLTEFRNDVDNTFGINICDELFGEGVLPEIERYFEFFEAISPVVAKAQKEQNEKIASIQQKYGLDRVAKVTSINEGKKDV